jgi:hypothetical protein
MISRYKTAIAKIHAGTTFPSPAELEAETTNPEAQAKK